MIADLKPYPAMKDSGVEWLGDVPEHWHVSKLRCILNRNTHRNRPDLPLLSVVREKGVIVRDVTSKDENHNFIPDDLTNYKVVRKGQFAMNKMKAWQGSFGVSRYEGIVSPAYFIFDVKGVDGRFFHTAIRSRSYVPRFTQASDGVRIGQWDLSEDRMRETSFSIPPLLEQAAIVRYLDHMDRRVRRLVRAKQKLIGLLEERSRPSSTAPSPAASTPTSPSNPPASSGRSTFPHTGQQLGWGDWPPGSVTAYMARRYTLTSRLIISSTETTCQMEEYASLHRLAA